MEWREIRPSEVDSYVVKMDFSAFVSPCDAEQKIDKLIPVVRTESTAAIIT